MPSRSSPHDAVFRRVLGEPVNAASQLRGILPAALVERLDLDRLTPAGGSFIDPTLQWRHTDLLFTVPLDGHEAFVYVLIEHQSSTDALMPLRMRSTRPPPRPRGSICPGSSSYSTISPASTRTPCAAGR
ncbi:Rpn family recombination-promoting nuclease/putative transposase [Phytoactinopolyspora halotolerans]|uniref:Rpn family recombination-promoting nuclease/putative transposase n=1 Tax=Phytoactinopolyspora halotolerans TaxID=1981512 RepID=A0A6L9SA86_9ACTN|nr:Rpn family recombination-promoting nuclease/putative transposase [Phytoactinopolyspora halotolerans]NEE02295.1 Rpn family recombination-promoting nuclease/putative transposase [Phytoactinopolyspora halotolerans]